MKFIDKEHKDFWNNKLKEMNDLGKTDCYYKSLIYTLGICETTRKYFNMRSSIFIFSFIELLQ